MSARTWKLLILAGLSVPMLSGVAALGPVAQPLDYHAFADQRGIAGIPHFWNVASNLPFAVVGATGIWWLAQSKRRREVVQSGEWNMYLVFFAGGMLTSLGSAYYHSAPSNPTLVWDRLVFSLMLTSFFAIVISEFVSPLTARGLLVPMIVAGVGSVIYWSWTESTGRGDLRPYLVVQFYPVILIPVIALLFKPRYASSRFLLAAWGLYAVAKVCELADPAIFDLTGFWSGHTLKHLIAALASYLPLRGLMERWRWR